MYLYVYTGGEEERIGKKTKPPTLCHIFIYIQNLNQTKIISKQTTLTNKYMKIIFQNNLFILLQNEGVGIIQYN